MPESNSRTKPFWFALFLILTIVYYGSVLFKGNVFLPGDSELQNYPLRHFLSESLKNLTIPLWNPNEFAGIPFIGAMQTGGLYLPNLLLYLFLPPAYAFNLSHILHISFAGFFVFLYLKTLGLDDLPSFLGGMVFAFSGFIESHKQHTAIINASVWLPLLLYLFEKLKKEQNLKTSSLIAFIISLQIFAGNLQMTVYTYMVLAVYLCFLFFALNRDIRMKFLAYGITAMAVGIIIALPQIISTMELNSLSMRGLEAKTLGYIFFREFHVYLKTLPSLIAPLLYSNGHIELPPSAILVFVGTLPLLASIVIFLRRFKEDKNILFWGMIGLMGLFLATADDTAVGKRLFEIPVYGMFRAQGRNIFEFSLAVAVLFAYAMNELLVHGKNIRAFAAALLFIILVSSALLLFAPLPALRFTLPAVFIPLTIMTLYLICLLLFKLYKKKWLIYLFVPLVFFEAYSYGAFNNMGGIPINKVSESCGKYDLMKRIEHKDIPYRVANIEVATTSLENIKCGVIVLNSYDQLILKDYARLFDLEPLGYSRYWDALIRGNSLLSMMNVRYLILPKDYLMDLETVSTVKTPPTEGLKMTNPSVKNISPKANPHANSMTIKSGFPEGTYLITFNAQAVGKKYASLRMEVFGDHQHGLRFSQHPLNSYPGLISDEEQEFFRLYHNDSKRDVNISFVSPLFESISISGMSLSEIKNYGPLEISTTGPVYEKILEADGNIVYLNKNALPRVYSVERIVPVRDILDVKRRFDLNTLNPSKDALVYENELPLQKEYSKGVANIENYGTRKVVINTDFAGTGFLVFADQYYPGWEALVDGQETRIYRVNGVIRGVEVPAGRHKIVFRYMPYRFFASLGLSIVLTLGIVFVLIRKQISPKQ